MSKRDPLETAHHEAAHAVFHLKLGLRRGRVSIKPTEDTLGHAELRRPKWFLHDPRSPAQEQRLRVQVESEILAALAGRIAEAKYTGRRIRWGHEEDYRKCAELAMSFISQWSDVQSAFFRYCEKRARLSVEEWWPEIQAVARALVERETLGPREVLQVIHAIPDEVFTEHHERLRKAWEEQQKRL